MPNHLDFSSENIGNEEVVKVLKQIDAHIQDTNVKLVVIENRVGAISNAFCDNDFDGHKRYHQTMIDILNEKRRLRIAIQEKTISGLIWAVIVIVIMALWHELLNLIGRGVQ
jgi:hypothetical protein